jgi:hypothetical protein
MVGEGNDEEPGKSDVKAGERWRGGCPIGTRRNGQQQQQVKRDQWQWNR